MTLDQVYDELYGEIDQIKNELKNTLAQIQYASNFTEGVSLGTLSVGAESSQVIAPHVSLLPGAESGMMVIDLPVGTESAMLPVQIQDDPEATDLVDDAIPTGETIESYLNSKFAYITNSMDTSGTMIDKTVNYPSGFNVSNCTIVALGVNAQSGAGYRFGNNQLDATSRYFARLGNDGIVVSSDYTSTLYFAIILMKL